VCVCQGNGTEEKVFVEKGFQSRFERTDRQKQGVGSQSLEPSKRKSADHST